jgi:redox-regulated HSP33 family molecular chaperone
MKLQLVAKITDAALLKKSIHEQGTLLYQTNTDGSITRVVYFSDSRVVEFVGTMNETQARIVKATGHKVNTIEVDEFQGYVRIVQGETA